MKATLSVESGQRLYESLHDGVRCRPRRSVFELFPVQSFAENPNLVLERLELSEYGLIAGRVTMRGISVVREEGV